MKIIVFKYPLSVMLPPPPLLSSLNEGEGKQFLNTQQLEADQQKLESKAALFTSRHQRFFFPLCDLQMEEYHVLWL